MTSVVRRLNFPLKVELELTARCNLRCQHCMVEHKNSGEGELSGATIKSLIDDWSEEGLLELQFTGGEPTIRPDFVDLVEYACERGIKVLVSSNGTLIDEELAERLGKSGAYVEISLDGGSAAVHEVIRGRNTFENTVSNARRLRRHTRRLMMETVVHRINFADLENIYEVVKSIGAYRYIIHNVRYIRHSLAHSDDLHLSLAQLEEIQARAFALRQRNEIQVQPPYLPVAGYLRHSNESFPHGVFGCGGLRYKIGVKADGKLLPCLLFDDDHLLGDVRRQSMRNVWNSSAAIDIYRQMHGAKPATCDSCAVSGKCGGGCPVAALSQGNGLGGSDLSCPVISKSV
uniref:Radical SAM additional 4Fe4S-binding SPASM domain-containing protein n=1 Tax=Candidatus Kentrum sp. UNK TaxID=2126344 RepID=A0A451AYN7_9GAMM|nr:MAG: radical SAM additional 4Fe4S-binding SPASM domain-containing protein [Candidatus Kentron sp. UNK]VFK71165.1 MAG: radical SAM additional 4Fe4S-binding SPASM domain-containing protein [Candidatus Kentron sp. UNK]